MKRTAFFALFWILVLLAGCSSNSAGSAGDMQPPAEAAPGLSTEAAAGEETAADSHSVSMPSDPGRKLIRTVWLTAETENFSGLMEQVSSHTTQLGGYVESQEADYGNASDQAQARRADLTIRIPAEQLQTFVSRISELSHILRSRETAEDITLTYADTESRMAALETERDRLMALMEQAETMEDLLAVESRLTEVRYQLESTGSQLKLYDNLVSYSTVYLAVEEVQKLTPTEQPTIWEKSPTASGKIFPPWEAAWPPFWCSSRRGLPIGFPWPFWRCCCSSWSGACERGPKPVRRLPTLPTTYLKIEFAPCKGAFVSGIP